MEKRRVLLYGRSVVLGSIGASLQRRPELEIFTLSPPFPTAQQLADTRPDVILFDAEAERPEAAFSLLETCPGLLLISVNPSDNQVRMWSGRDLSELSTQDLVGIIGRNYRVNSVEDEDCFDGISF